MDIYVVSTRFTVPDSTLTLSTTQDQRLSHTFTPKQHVRRSKHDHSRSYLGCREAHTSRSCP
jgi:hypothetical protein